MNLLTGGRRADDRHRSLQSALDWSYALPDEADRAVLRRVSVFAAPLSAATAENVCGGWLPAGAVPATLARLAEQSLLVATADGSGTRYRALETIRQYGAVQLARNGESERASSRHLSWCLDGAAVLAQPGPDDRAWRSAFDDLADELRAALGWAAARAERRPEAYRLAMALAGLSFTRGFPGESQRRYEQAAELAPDAGHVATALRCAAGAAKSRHFGDDALRLLQAAAARPRSGGDGHRSARRPGARADRRAERIRDLPFHREEAHLATARLIVVAALAGDWDEALALAGQFREGWEHGYQAW